MIILFAFVSIKAVSNLKEMGFQEDEIVMALKATVNNQEAAVSYSPHYFSSEISVDAKIKPKS